MIEAVLFDLDGTLADTAPDLGYALNQQRIARGLSTIPLELIRTEASAGARGLLGLGFNISPSDSDYPDMREEFLDLYAARLCHDTQLFPGVSELLDQLDIRKLPWGIVTNKPARFAKPLIHLLGLSQRAACLISGGDTTHSKPHPEPLLAASHALAVAPDTCIYLGDDMRDVEASLAAGMEPVIARYGYLGNGHPPESWGARYLIDHPRELLAYL
ncbi:MAG: Phosphoglycolate phosphatase [Nitrosomonadaceae bacterium]|nr:HAD-IA family hydrolase [Nitrosospira sp.]MCG3769032.1 Phosphoglycolate phosphatase [Nitrosomonadaceae bacterium]MBI0409330.1 HAD-IA family hydrolase [Nitrosospira sp.]MBI0410280.1 HAD-IA family hydrolase [Nitrosospira sp.]MBI0411811.1 HAD-IA family hydrolase [Nitrosospira sp.]